jgi:NAD(P)-dependent dehydrogenase (short-subunit alcohol dehydrogenase family)
MNEFFFSTYNELSKKNILINTIRIGLTKTKIHKKIKKNLAKRIQMIPIKRMASTKEVANYIFIYSTGFNTLTTKKIIDVTGGE